MLRAVVTGANRGIGLCLVKDLLKADYEVWATARNLSVSGDLQALKTSTLKLEELDVSSKDSVSGFFGKIPQPVDLLINNAGVYLDRGDSFEDLDFSKIVETMKVNTIGAMQVVREALKHLRASPQPLIIHITSRMGSIEDNTSGRSYAYRISKAALNMFNRSFANDYPQICSVVVHPGWVQTSMGGPHALISPSESAAGIVALAHNKDLQTGEFYSYRGDHLPW